MNLGFLKLDRASAYHKKSYTPLQSRAVGAYLGLAVGDALGATVEFLVPREIQERYGVQRDIQGGGWLNLKPGQVTDDTEMSLALGQSLIDNDGLVTEAVAESFSDWMRSKPVDIGNTVRRGIVNYRTTGKTTVPENDYDAGNGACMRSLPIAIAYHKAELDVLAQASRAQSHITHNNQQADAGTETLLRMLGAAMAGVSKQSLKGMAQELVEQHTAFRFDRRLVENPSGWIVETLQAVFQSFFAHDDFETILVDVVNRGGDADTTGAIAGMLAGAYYGVEFIPLHWLNALDRKVACDCEVQALALLHLAERSPEPLVIT
ncbi:MAG: ADP-ribosyl-[dinitrogen reductase] hydrolase [Sedimenticola sp.]